MDTAQDAFTDKEAVVSVLLVEDNMGDARLVEFLLAEVDYCAFSLTHMKSFADTQQILSEQVFDVILLDLSLPDVSGLDTVRGVQNLASALPIVVLSGTNDEAMALQAVHVGAQDYLFKGEGDGHSITRAIRHAIERKQASQEIKKHAELMESRVLERTKSLNEANQSLRSEIKIRAQKEQELSELTTQLQRSNQELESFAYVASHDLQEPLRKLQLFSDRIKDVCGAELSPRGKEYVNRMLHATARMREFIHDLLAYSRLSCRPENFVTVDMTVLVVDVLSDLEVAIDESNALIHKGRLCHIEADPFLLRRLLQNVIGNALKYRSNERRLTINIEGHQVLIQNEAYFELRIQDNGIGFDNSQKERVFGMFERLHERGSYAGTGVGLAVTKKIVDIHHGTCSASGVCNQGATFVITLPIKRKVMGPPSHD